MEFQIKNKRKDIENLSRRFFLMNEEHQRLLNESILLNGVIHRKKQRQVKRIQKAEKKRFRKKEIRLEEEYQIMIKQLQQSRNEQSIKLNGWSNILFIYYN